MANVRKPMPIHLSNRTAIGLRKTAQRVRGAWLVAMGIFAMIATVVAVYLGFSWLPAVPLTLLAAGGIIVLMMIVSRSQYLLLISQAICTEAASRGMEERASEQKRRQKAIEQLAIIREDVREAQKNGLPAVNARTEESLLFDLLTGADSTQDIASRRSMQEDDEMYGADYQEESDDQSDEDLFPPKPPRKPQPPIKPTVSVTQSTRIVASSVAAKAPALEDAPQAPRRRRRKAPAQTAPLQLIRNDQAQ